VFRAGPRRRFVHFDEPAWAGEATMAEPSFTAQVASLNTMLGEIEGRVAKGEVPAVDLTEFKSSVDELRLRLWALLGAGSANDYRGFQERFRLRRAREICRGLEGDLRQGAISPRHDELAPLGEAAGALARAVNDTRPPNG
jgi:hypothetical protein